MDMTFKPFASLATAFALVPVACLAQPAMRPPAVPLITHDPYFSVWSDSDNLADSNTRHWTGTEQPITSLVRIDGKTFRLMGKSPTSLPAMHQAGLQVLPTRTIYRFDGGGVDLTLTFTTPSIPSDVDLLSRPATYLTWTVASTDGKPHEASIYFDASATLTVNSPDQKVRWDKPRVSGLNVLRVGSEDQSVLQRSGDNLRIEWGHLAVAAPGRDAVGVQAMQGEAVRQFAASGRLAQGPKGKMPIAAGEAPVSAFSIPFGRVSRAAVSRHLIVAYDDEYSIMYFNRKLRPYWRRNGAQLAELLKMAERDYAKVGAQCEAFDKELVNDLTSVGGEKYAYVASLAFRQSLAAQKVVADAKGQPLMFSKENFSNGCIATVDVLYPAAPELLLFSPTLIKASLVPVMDYAASSRWRFPFAPHDLGTYPLANGQVYGGGERTEDNQMPVEESGNLLLLLAALAKEEGNADFAARYWTSITKWADYLVTKGFDPESQLSTDDFAGHLAHNVNLSAKAIEALGAYAYLCDIRGMKAESAKYRGLAEQFAARWTQAANDGDHFRLAFDKPGTWSQKYNLVWDRILGLNLFPASVARKEMDFYLKSQNSYGLPLDNRRDYTKLDWILWTATLTGNRGDFEALVSPIVDFLNATPDRAPMADWFRTKEPRKEGFQARSVVGGVFIKMLDSPALWTKYTRRDPNQAKDWAPIPAPIVVREIVPTSLTTGLEWSYTTDRPLEGWFKPAFDDSNWKRGLGGFGTGETPSTKVRTVWSGDDIWLRREFELTNSPSTQLRLYIHHDEDAEVYINGILAARLTSYTTRYQLVPISKSALASLKRGKNSFAVHCHQTYGGQYIDLGLAEEIPG